MGIALDYVYTFSVSTHSHAWTLVANKFSDFMDDLFFGRLVRKISSIQKVDYYPYEYLLVCLSTNVQLE